MVHERDGDVSHLKPFGDVRLGDVTDPQSCRDFCDGMDVVLHLAADASPAAKWDSVLPLNIAGTYNVFAAAKHAGVRRVVYASSIHAVSGYPSDVQIGPDFPVNPGDLYGVSKCFGEALGRYMAEREGVSCIAVRIGAVQPRSVAGGSQGVRLMDAFVSRRDLQSLLEKCVEADHLKWAVVNALSDNHFKRLDITTARELLGYAPQDDSARLNPDLDKLHLDQVQTHANTDPAQSGLRDDV